MGLPLRAACRLKPCLGTLGLFRGAHRQQRGLASAATVVQEPVPYHEISRLPPPVRDPPMPHPLPRQQRIRDAKPFSSFLTDNFSRRHDYLRISITERCNLRCTYCMPEEGVPLSAPSHLLTTPEISYLSALFVNQGVTKIRLTGGEPTIRKEIVPMMRQIGDLRRNGLKELCITTNGIALHRKLDAMAEAGLTGVNLSLDTLDPFQFQLMTRRKGFDAVIRSIERILEMNRLGAGIKLKINCVVMRGINEREILPFVELGRGKDIEVRFIEYMPFDGNKWSQGKMLSYKEMLSIIQERYPELRKVRDHENDTSKTYEVPGFVGRIGFITSMTHNFCGTCNRLRITSDGNLKVCLFGNAEVSLRDLLRKDHGGQPIDEEAMEALKQVEMDRRQTLPGDASSLGFGKREVELLEVIGMAVKRKKEKHAGMGELENMKNRPMILIDERPYRQQSPPQAPAPIRLLPRANHTTLSTPKAGLLTISSIYRSIPRHLLATPANSSTSTRTITTTPPKIPPPQSPTAPPSAPPASSTSPTPPASPPPSLPHLTPTSEIHLISTTPKPPTHRRALALGHVRFSTATPLPLLRAHALKKGDVIAVARVAALMALKRTADLIPLAHGGVGIEGARVWVEAVDGGSGGDDGVGGGGVAPSATSTTDDVGASGDEEEIVEDAVQQLTTPIGDFGGVRIAVDVETTGKTGVEMEALVGVVGAALTVVDMCKAVDRGCEIGGVRVVGKSGGRSGGWGVWEGGGKWEEEAVGETVGKGEL